MDAPTPSLDARSIDRLLDLSPAERAKVLEPLSPEEKQALYVVIRHDWRRWCRPEQLPPDDLGIWDVWVLLSGRGGGKTRPASQLVNHWGQHPEEYTDGEQGRICLVARDAGACRDVMVEGASGIIESAPPWFRPKYEPSKRRVTWPSANGQPKVIAEMHSAEEPKSLRGPNFHKGWGDEWAAWHRKDPTQPPEAWTDGLDMNVRLGRKPQTILTSTPVGAEFVSEMCYGPRDVAGKRLVTPDDVQKATRVLGHTKSGAPISVSRWFFDIHTEDGPSRTVVSRWSSERNKSNLAPGKVAKLRAKYGGSRIGRQELDGEILDKIEGALWDEVKIRACRVGSLPRLRKIEVAVDPTRADDPTDECGIMVGAVGEDGIGYLLEDCSITASPDGWAAAAVSAYRDRSATAMIYEQNGLGRKKQDTIRTIDPAVKWVPVTAIEDKFARASPIASLFANGKIKHYIKGLPSKGLSDDNPETNPFAALEAELTGWDPKNRKSPNRLDAYVWLFTSLMLGVKVAYVSAGSETKESHYRP